MQKEVFNLNEEFAATIIGESFYLPNLHGLVHRFQTIHLSENIAVLQSFEKEISEFDSSAYGLLDQKDFNYMGFRIQSKINELKSRVRL